MSFSSLAQLKLKQIWVNGKEYNSTQKIYLKAMNNDLVFDFTSEVDSALFHFRIKEISEAWTQSYYPTAHYHNLSGGKYTFQIYSKTNKKQFNPISIVFEVKEAFWQKVWFWPSVFLYIILLIGVGLYLFFLYDFRQKLKLQHIRNQIASDLHDEVGSNLNSIAIFVELLRKKVKEQPDLLPLLNKITDNSEETVSLMKDTVWAINPSNDTTEKLIERMRSFGLEILTAKGIAYDFICEIDSKKNHFTMEQRRNIYLVYKEAINNIVKHSSAINASCKIEKKQDLITIAIEDNGKGFNLNRNFDGNGLTNFRLRNEADDLSISIDSIIGKGTTIIISVII